MEESSQLQDLIAKRLLLQVGELVEEKEQEVDTQPQVAQQNGSEILPSRDFIKIEKNLASLGLFTPSTKRVKNKMEKRITFTKVIDGKKVEVSATIKASSGLPITADQDKFYALQNILNDIKQQIGTVANPIAFTSARILRLLGKHRDSGKNYKDIDEWLDVMSSITIISEGAIYLAGKKRWAKDRFHVFDRAISFGKELPTGEIADRNYVWLSEWQLQNINDNYLLPIDFETYKNLKNHIAKALVPLLQVWLYTTREDGLFEKRYDELCQTLSVRQYQHVSKIKEKLGPSLDELQAQEYLADWKIEKTSDGKSYKIVFYHGEKFHRDRRQRLGQKEKALTPTAKEPIAGDQPRIAEEGIGADPVLELTKRGINEERARHLLSNLVPGQQVMDQLEWGDTVIAHDPGKILNPAGFYVSLIKDNITPAANFETSRKQRLREEAAQASEHERQEEARLELAYEDYRKQQIDQYIKTQLSDEIYRQQVEVKRGELLSRYTWARRWSDGALLAMAEHAARTDITKQLPVLTFEVFRRLDSHQPWQLEKQPPSPTGEEIVAAVVTTESTET